MRSPRVGVPVLVAALLLLGGCGSADPPENPSGRAPETTTVTTGDTKEPEGARRSVDPLEAPRCPEGASNCERASGTIIYVERVDPDGDGDAHFVLAGGDDITGSGISVIDVRTNLRPDPLPGPGDRLAASGPVFEGSYGQRQIQADQVVVGR